MLVLITLIYKMSSNSIISFWIVFVSLLFNVELLQHDLTRQRFKRSVHLLHLNLTNSAFLDTNNHFACIYKNERRPIASSVLKAE